jgi:hypothetical protein
MDTLGTKECLPQQFLNVGWIAAHQQRRWNYGLYEHDLVFKRYLELVEEKG